MRVLMLSIDDRTLLGEQAEGRGAQGDTVKRHVRYGALVDKLDIIVTALPGFSHVKLSDKVDVYPTNSRGALGHFISMVRYAGSFAAHEGFDLIVAQDMTAPAARWIAKRYKRPYIVSTHAADWDTPDWQRGLGRRLTLPLIKAAMRRADGLRVVSPRIKDFYARAGISCPIEVIPTTQDYSIFSHPYQGGVKGGSSDRVKQIRNKYKAEYLLLTDGRLESVKNYPLLLGALKLIITPPNDKRVKRFESIKLLIIGIGSLEKELKAKVVRLGLRDQVVFLGSRSYGELVPYYQACDVFVLASDSESLGKVLLQAGAAGKPVISTNTLGARGLVTDGETGYLVPVGDEHELAGKVIELLADEEFRVKMGKLAQQYVLKNYDVEVNTKKWVDFWCQILDRFSNRRFG